MFLNKQIRQVVILQRHKINIYRYILYLMALSLIGCSSYDYSIDIRDFSDQYKIISEYGSEKGVVGLIVKTSGTLNQPVVLSVGSGNTFHSFTTFTIPKNGSFERKFDWYSDTATIKFNNIEGLEGSLILEYDFIVLY